MFPDLSQYLNVGNTKGNFPLFPVVLEGKAFQCLLAPTLDVI